LDSIKDKTNLFLQNYLFIHLLKMAFWKLFEEDTSAPHHKKSGERMKQLVMMAYLRCIEGVPLSLRLVKLLPGDRRDNSDSSAKTTKCTRGAEKRSC
jgi:hypothetical protein